MTLEIEQLAVEDFTTCLKTKHRIVMHDVLLPLQEKLVIYKVLCDQSSIML
jgi:hypothetical protein